MANSRASRQQFDRVRDRILTIGTRDEIRSFVRGIRDMDRLQEWVAFENANQRRQWVLELLKNRADEIRSNQGEAG